MKVAPSTVVSRLLLLPLLVFGLRLSAQQMDTPVYYNITFQSTVYTQPGQPAYSGFAALFVDETGVLLNSNIAGPVTANGPLCTAKILPNKDYTLTISGAAFLRGAVTFSTPAGIPYSLRGDGSTTCTIAFDGNLDLRNNPGVSRTYKIRLGLARNYPLGSAPDDLRAGEPSSLASDKPIWYVGLGRMRNGESAGAIGFRRPDFSGNFFSPAALYYDAIDPSEISTIYASSVLRQVYAREVLADIVTLSATSYRIAFYPRAQVQGLSAGVYTTTGNPFVTYTVEQISGGNGVQITRSDDITWTTSLVLDGATWTHRDWRAAGAPDAKVTTTFNTPTAATVSHVGPPAAGGGLETALVWNKAFADYGGTWGKELTETRYGATEAVPLVSQYQYYPDSAQTGGYPQKLCTTVAADGNWKKYEYFPASSTNGLAGRVQRVYAPWLDTPATPASATTANSAYTEYTYNTEKPDFLASAISYAPGGVITTKSTWTHTFNAGTLNNYLYRTEARSDYYGSGSADALVTTSKYFRWDLTDRYMADKPISVAAPDGRKISYAYFNGTWDSAARTFTAAATGADRLILAFQGQTAAGTPAGVSVSSFALGGTTWTMDPLYLVANRSTVAETVVDTCGRTVLSAQNVYTAAGTLERVGGTAYRYDAHGRLTDEVDLVRSSGTNELKTVRTYSNSLPTSVTGADGIVTTYEYDNLLRLVRTTTGAGGLSPRVKETKYDGANRVSETYTCSCSTAPTLFQYDSAGRISMKLEPGPDENVPLVTLYGYPDQRTVSTVLPTGSTRTENRFLDGRLKAITGTAQAPTYVDYELNGTGLLTRTRNYADLSWGWSETQQDWLGRTVRSSNPAWGWTAGSANIVDVTRTYAATTGLREMERTSYRLTGAKLVPDTRYLYNSDASIKWAGLDVSDDGQLTEVSTDRITAYDQAFVKSGSSWYVRATTWVAPTMGAGLTLQGGMTSTRLTGFTQPEAGVWVLAEATVTDVSGKQAVQQEFIRPSAKTRWSTQTVPGATNVAKTTWQNGLMVDGLSASGVPVHYVYDSLGRLAQQQTRPNGATYDVQTSYEYYGSTEFVKKTTAGGIATNYSYAWGSDGTRTVAVTDALGNAARTRYNAMDRPWRHWGPAAQPAEFGYDPLGRQVSMTLWRTGSFGGTDWPTQPGTGDTTAWTFEPATGLLRSKTDAAGNHIDFSYTPGGQPATRTWARCVAGTANRIVTTYAYYDGSTTDGTNPAHRTQALRAVSYNDGTAGVSYTYNRTGALATVTDVTGTRSFAYRSDLLPDSEVLPSGFYGDNRTVQFTYDADAVNGRASGFQLKSGANIEAGQALAFDPATGRITSIGRTPGGESFAYAYRAGTDLLASITHGAFQQSFAYEANRDLLASVETKWSTSTVAKFAYTYDAVGRRQAAVQTGSLFARYPESALATKYGYNERSEVTASTTSFGTDADATAKRLLGRQNGYAFDLAGNRNSTSVDGRSVSYATNSLNEVVSRGTPGYVDVTGVAPAAATVTANSVTAERQGEYFRASVAVGSAAAWLNVDVASSFGGSETRRTFVPAATETFTYDVDGNMTADGRWTYTWDGENRLVAMETAAAAISAGVPPQKLEFTYDYLSRRVAKRVSAKPANSWVLGKETRLLYQNWNLVAEFDVSLGTAALGLLRSYTWGLGNVSGAGTLLLISDALTGKRYLPVYDGMGNVSALVDRADGSVAASYEYDAFGNTLRAAGPYAANNPFRHATKYTDEETGLIYYGLRFYDPSLGRFNNRDPIAESGGMNLYAACGNDFSNKWDILGLSCQYEYSTTSASGYLDHYWCTGGSTPSQPELVRPGDRVAQNGAGILNPYPVIEKISQPPSDPTDGGGSRGGAPFSGYPLPIGGGGGSGSSGQGGASPSAPKSGDKARLEKIRDQILEKLCGDSKGEAAVSRLGAANVNMAFSNSGLGGVTTLSGGVFTVNLFVPSGADALDLAESAFHESVHTTQGADYSRFAALSPIAQRMLIGLVKKQMEFQAYYQSASYALSTLRQTSHGSFVTEIPGPGGVGIIDPGKVMAFVSKDAVPETGNNAASRAADRLIKEDPQLEAIGGWNCAEYRQRTGAQK